MNSLVDEVAEILSFFRAEADGQPYDIVRPLKEQYAIQILSLVKTKLLEGLPQPKQQVYVEKMNGKATMTDESWCRFYRYGGYDFALRQVTTTIKSLLEGKDE